MSYLVFPTPNGQIKHDLFTDGTDREKQVLVRSNLIIRSRCQMKYLLHLYVNRN